MIHMYLNKSYEETEKLNDINPTIKLLKFKPKKIKFTEMLKMSSIHTIYLLDILKVYLIVLPKIFNIIHINTILKEK